MRSAHADVARRRRLSTWLRRVGIGVGVLLAVLAITVTAAAIFVHTDGGRQVAARRIESVVSSQIRGQLRIGRVTDISASGISARDVRFSAPDGEDVLVLDDVDLELRWAALLGGRFVAPSGRARGGRVILRDAGHGLDFDLAFRNPHPGGVPALHDPAPIDFQNLEATGIGLSANVHGVPTAAVTGMRSVVHVWLPYPGGAVRLEAHGLAGHVAIHTPIPIVLAMTSGSLRFDGSARERAVVDVQGVINDVHVHWTNSVVQRGRTIRVASVLTVPDFWAALREAPLIAEASIAELSTSGFDFSLRVGATSRRPRADRRGR